MCPRSSIPMALVCWLLMLWCAWYPRGYTFRFPYLHEPDFGSENFVGPFCPISFDHILIGLKKILRQAVLAQMPVGGENKKKGDKKNLLLHHTRLHTCRDACTPDLALCPTPALHLGAIHETARPNCYMATKLSAWQDGAAMIPLDLRVPCSEGLATADPECAWPWWPLAPWNTCEVVQQSVNPW